MNNSPTLDDVLLSPPTIGPGHMAICDRCALKLDIANKIAVELNKKCLPVRIVNGMDEWELLRKYLELWREQNGLAH